MAPKQLLCSVKVGTVHVLFTICNLIEGSDLDGDEYSVIWDEQLLFDYNEEPMDFSKLARTPDSLEDDEVVIFHSRASFFEKFQILLQFSYENP